MLMLLMPVMIFMWLISGLFIWGLVPPINYVRFSFFCFFCITDLNSIITA